jgi:hypothetical protein
MLNIVPYDGMLAENLQHVLGATLLQQALYTRGQKPTCGSGLPGACRKTVSHENKGPWNIDLFLVECRCGLG